MTNGKSVFFFRRIITLLTDFGSQDYFVGAMKGAILSLNPSAQIVDITTTFRPRISTPVRSICSEVTRLSARHNSRRGCRSWCGSLRKPLLIECAGQFFIGPDNGIFSWICEREGKIRAILLQNEKFFRHPVSATFHGRDIFAPVAAALSNGVVLEEFGDPVKDYVRLESLAVKTVADGQVEARIIHIDRFGNCVTNLTRDHVSDASFKRGAKLSLNRRDVSSLRRFFAEPADPQSELFCIFGSAGFLEIAAQGSSAAAILDARRGQPVLLALDHDN